MPCLLVPALLLAGLTAQVAAARRARPTVAIVCPNNAESPVRIAAQELADGLSELYKDDVFRVSQGRTPPEARYVIHLGTSATLPRLAASVTDRLQGAESYVVTTVETDGQTVGLIVGRDASGVMYGVHGLLEELGKGRYLSMDVPPEPLGRPFDFVGWDLADRPLVPTRLVLNWHNFLSSCSTWNLEHWCEWIERSQRMGFNTIMVHAYGNNPMAGFRFRDVDKPVGYLGSTRLGRSWFVNHANDVRNMHGSEVFDQPVFGSTAAVDGTNGDRTKAAHELMGQVFDRAAQRGVRVVFALDIDTPPGNPQELITLLDESDRFLVQGRWLPNPDTPGGYAFYRAQVAGLLEAYPQIGTLALWHRSGGTPWMGYRHEEMPDAWQKEFDVACRETPGTEDLWHARHMFGMAKIARACEKALVEIGRRDVSLAFGSWHYSFLAGADRFMPEGVALIPLDWMVLVDQSQLRDADSRAVIGRVAAHRPVLPVVWAHHDDGAYVMRPFMPFDKFQDRLDDAHCSAHGYGIIHWTTRPLDLYFVSLARQTWSRTRNEPFAVTCRRAAGHWFGSAHQETFSRYLQQWMAESPMYARETSDWFVDRPLDEPQSVLKSMQARLGPLDDLDTTGMRADAKDRIEYFRGIESFTAEVHRLESAFRTAHRLIGEDRLDEARKVARPLAEEVRRVIGDLAATLQRGDITRGDQGLIVTLNTRWLPHYVRLNQRLGIAPIRYDFGPTVHDPIAPRPGKFTFLFDPGKRIWQTLGEKETGAEVVACEPYAAPTELVGIARHGLKIDEPLTIPLRPIMYGAYGGKEIKQSPQLPAGQYRLTAWLVRTPDRSSCACDLTVSCDGEPVGQVSGRVGVEALKQPQLFPLDCRVTIESSGQVKMTVSPTNGAVVLAGVILVPIGKVD
ncbi:MAG: alpha-glucuronidase family glycosyl hydrolase [Thermoguttaceae bacterium]